MGRYLPLLLCALLLACAPGYTAQDMKVGAEEDVTQIDDRFKEDVRGTEKMAEDAEKDVENWAGGTAKK